MGLIHDILGIGKEEEMELPAEEEEGEKRKVNVRIETLVDFVDIDRIARFVKEGNIVFLKTAQLQRQDLGEFQNCVQKLKRISTQNNWDLVGTTEGYILITPSFATIKR